MDSKCATHFEVVKGGYDLASADAFEIWAAGLGVEGHWGMAPFLGTTPYHRTLNKQQPMLLNKQHPMACVGAEGMALVFTWLRLSSTRVLPWYKNSNYQSKDIAHVQKGVAQNMADTARSAPDPYSRMYARMALGGLPRGGGNGDDIRMGILHIMRAHGIKEGHRPVRKMEV